jgi:hypothetical protein
MTRRSLLLAVTALALAGCATARPVVVAPGAGPAELEPVYAVIAGRDALTLRVASNGCTKKEDFAFFVERKGEATTVAFARKRLDRCRSFAAGHADLVFTLAELGVAANAPLFVLNPFARDPSPGAG